MKPLHRNFHIQSYLLAKYILKWRNTSEIFHLNAYYSLEFFDLSDSKKKRRKCENSICVVFTHPSPTWHVTLNIVTHNFVAFEVSFPKYVNIEFHPQSFHLMYWILFNEWMNVIIDVRKCMYRCVVLGINTPLCTQTQQKIH